MQGHEHTRQLLYLSIYHFKLGNCADLMTSRLLVVSLLFQLKNYCMCEIILRNIENDVKRYVISECRCYLKKHVGLIEFIHRINSHGLSHETTVRTMIVGCVDSYIP